MTCRNTACLGLLRRKERWSLSLRGWLILFGLGGLLIAGGGLAVHPFLALNAPVEADTLVVEGWVSDVSLEAAIREFGQLPDQALYITGGPITRGSHLSEFKTYAELGAAQFRKLGLDPARLVAVPAPESYGNRTFQSALALQRFLQTRDVNPTGVNVLTEGAHARRTRLLFQRALGNATRVGVICVPKPDYDQRRWWLYSEGWRSVIGESAGYLFAKVAVKSRR